MLVAASFLGLAGAGQTLVVLIGGIDFSVPAVIAGASVVVSQLTGTDHWSFIPALAVMRAAGRAGGRDQWLCVTPIPSAAAGRHARHGVGRHRRGAGVDEGSGDRHRAGVPHALDVGHRHHVRDRHPARRRHLGGDCDRPRCVILRRTIAGRRLYATGSNPVAAELALVRTQRVWVGTFAASALLAALLGVLLAGYAGSGNTTLGVPTRSKASRR